MASDAENVSEDDVLLDDVEGLEDVGEEEVDAPDIRIPHRDQDYRDGDIAVTWKEDDGRIVIQIVADARITITEQPGADGPVYTSVAFKGKKINLKDAIGLAVRNEVNRTFLDQWARTHKPERRLGAAEIARLSGENQRVKASLEQREARLRALLGADLDDLDVLPDPKAVGDQTKSHRAKATPGSKASAGR